MRQHATGPAPGIQYQKISRSSEETVHERQRNVTHSNEPPQLVLELIEPFVLFFFHWVGIVLEGCDEGERRKEEGERS
jgi:hypothetical protein